MYLPAVVGDSSAVICIRSANCCLSDRGIERPGVPSKVGLPGWEVVFLRFGVTLGVFFSAI